MPERWRGATSIGLVKAPWRRPRRGGTCSADASATKWPDNSGKGFFHRASDDIGLGFTDGDEFNATGLENRGDAHRQGTVRDLGEIAEKDRVIAAGDFV